MSNIDFNVFLKKSKFNYKKARYLHDYYDKIMDLGLFDGEYYLKSYNDVKNSGMDPLLHYLFYGFKEKKSPSSYFDINRYYEKFPEIKDKDINPLIHYIEHNQENLESINVVSHRKDRIIQTNSLFLSNYEFENEPLVSIIILNHNGLDNLKCLFKDFDKNTNYSNYEIIVVDNASCDESVEYLYSLKESLPLIIIENSENLSFSKANNDAAKIAKGDFLLLMNNDIEPTFGWLNELVGTFINNDNVGAVGAKLVFPYYNTMENQEKSFSIQHAGVKFEETRTPYVYGPYHENIFSKLIFSKEIHNQKEVIANTAATLLIPKDLFLEFGGFDEGFFYGYEDIDLALKLYSEGYKSIYVPSALLFHHESLTRKNHNFNQINYKNIMYFVSIWGDFLFKEILRDKLQHNHFFTDATLNFSIVSNDDCPEQFILNFAKDLNEHNYDINLISDINNLYLEKTDILISFNSNYDIDNVLARDNLIKILILDEYKDNIDKDYDLIIINSANSGNKFVNSNIFTLDFDKSDFTDSFLELMERIYLK